jgi:hypothetical protein
MKKSERLVQYYDLDISASARNFAAPSTISVRRAFELMEHVGFEQRLKESAKGQELLYVADWRWEGDVISILVSKSDKSISDPVFTVPKEGRRRTAEKEDQEGQDFSVHMAIKLSEGKRESALVVVEYCSGLGIFVVQRLLNQILRDAKKISPADFEQMHPDGSIDEKGQLKKLKVTFKCDFEGHLSDELRDDLNKGKVQSIELITEKGQHTFFDEEGYIQEKCKTVVLTLKDEDNPLRDKFDRIVKVVKKSKDDYSRARIKFKTPEGIDRTVDMTTAEGLTQSYVKKAKLDGFDGDLKSSYDKFNDQILGKMQSLLYPEE